MVIQDSSAITFMEMKSFLVFVGLASWTESFVDQEFSLRSFVDSGVETRQFGFDMIAFLEELSPIATRVDFNNVLGLIVLVSAQEFHDSGR